MQICSVGRRRSGSTTVVSTQRNLGTQNYGEALESCSDSPAELSVGRLVILQG